MIRTARRWWPLLAIGVAIAAWAGIEELRPNGDVTVTGWSCTGTCWDEVDEDFTGTGDDGSDWVDYTDCTENNVDRYLRFTATDPSNTVSSTTNAQTLRITARKCPTSGTNTPTFTPMVWCNGDADASPRKTGSAGSLTSTTEGHLLSFVWTYDFSGGCAGSAIEIGGWCDSQGGGPTARANCGVNAIEWEATVNDPGGARRVIIVSQADAP